VLAHEGRRYAISDAARSDADDCPCPTHANAASRTIYTIDPGDDSEQRSSESCRASAVETGWNTLGTDIGPLGKHPANARGVQLGSLR
jgi:hypothetical protein